MKMTINKGLSTVSCQRPVFSLIIIITLIHLGFVNSLRDDWYGFVSFEETSEWGSAYSYTCSYSIDLFREPREYTRRNKLVGRRELHTPIRFKSVDTLKAPENITLHVYNNPGIRKGYSVSYGFQQNKECLHGQDSECVVYPELARVRATVLNAERFSEQQNLNYIKDHFLVEKPERFVTILNGGSIFERKFYEAVFLGGYTDDEGRSSHQIDGIKYPLEIYMFFLDETVPSVSLSTIVVVLVEESDRDNTYIKPITNAIQHKLYDTDRRFLEKNKALTRRHRLYHHMKHSTFYDVFDTRKWKQHNQTIFQEALDSSIDNEAVLTRFVEPFERMQALEAELYFLLEDHILVNESETQNNDLIKKIYQKQSNNLIPVKLTEYLMMGLVSAYWGYIGRSNNETCEAGVQNEIIDGGFLNRSFADDYRNTSQVPTGTHLDEFAELVVKVCNHFKYSLKDVLTKNNDDTYVKLLDVDEKYEFIEQFVENRKEMEELNKLIYEHFHGTNPQWHFYNGTEEIPDYSWTQQKYHIIEGFVDFLTTFSKRKTFRRILAQTQADIDNVAKRLGHQDEAAMNEVILFLKYGSKQNDLKHSRETIHNEWFHRELPHQKKKRTLVEYGGMEIDEQDILDMEEMRPVKAIVEDAFQISWLMPQSGGYYYYEGSSPLPPCFRASNVIIFKQPISMSRHQIDILTRIPTSFERSEDIRFTTPRLFDTKFEVVLMGADTGYSRIEEVKVDVFNQERNHLFMGHDGVHLNAVEEWTKRKHAQKNGGIVGKKAGKFVSIITMLVIYIKL